MERVVDTTTYDNSFQQEQHSGLTLLFGVSDMFSARANAIAPRSPENQISTYICTQVITVSTPEEEYLHR